MTRAAWLGLVLVCSCGEKAPSKQPAPTIQAPSPSPVQQPRAPAATARASIEPPAPFASLRTNVPRAEIEAALSSSDRASLLLDGSRVVAFRFPMPAGTLASLTAKWGAPWEEMEGGTGSTAPNRDLDRLLTWTHVAVWNDPIGGWLARLFTTSDGELLVFQNDRPDKALMRKGEQAFSVAAKLVGTDRAAGDAAREAAVATPYRLFPEYGENGRINSVQIVFVYLGIPGARWTWPAMFRERFGAPVLDENGRLRYPDGTLAEDDRTNGRWLLVNAPAS